MGQERKEGRRRVRGEGGGCMRAGEGGVSQPAIQLSLTTRTDPSFGQHERLPQRLQGEPLSKQTRTDII